MANVAKVLQDEMRRMARKEIRIEMKRVHAENVSMRKAIRGLKAQLTELEQGMKVSGSPVIRGLSEIRSLGSGPVSGRFSSESIRRLRKRLAISQRELALLVGVSSQAVYLWECKGGKLRLRNDTRRALAKIKEMGKREIRKELDARGC
ncbi:MAG: hypothetical protein QGI24_08945 [Kiritimatiellia bacterium]|nr:hypothetical protein [Kiritimatiellia bacterium]MDP6848899.1 hypothetical protein [Kiritimatiellia bacterium]